MINVTHLNTVGTGGAYKAVERMSEAMNELQSVSSTVLLRNKVFDDSDAMEFLNNPAKAFLSKTKNFINKFFADGEISRDLLGSHVCNHPAVKNADVIIIHWINSFLSYASLKEIVNLGKPVIIFAHDMWHMTGGCHNNADCDRYSSGCVGCPQTKSDRMVAAKNYSDKKNILSSSNVTLITPSNDYLERAKTSGILQGVNKKCIFNCLNTKSFRTLDVKPKASDYGLSDDIPIVMFCADNAGINNKNKGFDLLAKALSEFKKDQIQLLVVGNIDRNVIDKLGFDYYAAGYIHDEKEMIKMYNLATVNVVPSLQESFCYSSAEALACGTPVVSFPVGGLKDQVVHRKNGYLAKYKDSHDLAEGIRYCIDNYSDLSSEASKSAERFSYEVIGADWEKYLMGVCNEKI